MVDKFRRGAALGAERLTSGVRRIGFKADEAAVLDDRDRAATGDAQSAIGVNTLCGLIGHRQFSLSRRRSRWHWAHCPSSPSHNLHENAFKNLPALLGRPAGRCPMHAASDYV